MYASVELSHIFELFVTLNRHHASLHPFSFCYGLFIKLVHF